MTTQNRTVIFVVLPNYSYEAQASPPLRPKVDAAWHHYLDEVGAAG
jgi:hypothetical protein